MATTPTTLLMSVDDLRSKLGFGDGPDIESALESALRLATISIEGLLRDRFARVDATDVFFVAGSLEFAGGRLDRDRDIERRITAGGRVPSATLQLSRGNLISITSAYASFTNAGLAVAADRTDLTTILDGSSSLLTRETEGEVRIVDFALMNQYVEIQYLAGYLDDDGCPSVYEDVPDWLQEMALIQASITLNSNPQVRREPLPPDELSNLKEIRGHIIDAHARYSPMSWKTKDVDTVASTI